MLALTAAVAAVLIGGLVFALVVLLGGDSGKSYLVPSTAMSPAIEAGSTNHVDYNAYKDKRPQRGDVILFDPTPSATRTCLAPTGPSDPFVKRVIGVEGDRVELVRDGPTLVNGRPFAVENAAPNPESKLFPQVPKDSLLVLGDNRVNSCDSHQWVPSPFVPEGNVIGKADVD